MNVHSRLYIVAKAAYDKLRAADGHDAIVAARREAVELLQEAFDNLGRFDLPGEGWRYMRLLNSATGNKFKYPKRKK